MPSSIDNKASIHRLACNSSSSESCESANSKLEWTKPVFTSRIKKSESKIKIIDSVTSQNKGGNQNRNHEPHSNLGMENEELISKPFSKFFIISH